MPTELLTLPRGTLCWGPLCTCLHIACGEPTGLQRLDHLS